MLRLQRVFQTIRLWKSIESVGNEHRPLSVTHIYACSESRRNGRGHGDCQNDILASGQSGRVEYNQYREMENKQ